MLGYQKHRDNKMIDPPRLVRCLRMTRPLLRHGRLYYSRRMNEFLRRRPEIQCRGEGAPVVIPTRFTEDVRADARILAQEEAAFSAASFALASALAAVRAARSECHAAVIYCVNRPNGSASTFVSGL